jgi:hypothetical protein
VTATALRPARLRPVRDLDAVQALESITARVHTIASQLAWFGVTERIERRLLDLAQRIGYPSPEGTAIPIRADFNTLDNPFFFADEPGVIQEGPVAGIHFLVFNPSSDDFERNRLAMDGVLPGGSLEIPPRDRAQGFNSILTTTHRQNFLVPPRRHRSFPLAEL